jgi:hypothetical protein
MIGNGTPNNQSSAPRPMLILTTSYGPDPGRITTEKKGHLLIAKPHVTFIEQLQLSD